jgi:ribulose-phosphate 3-epimerase
MNVYPAILTGSIEEAQQQLDRVAPIEEVRTVQIDVIDGLFAENTTITPADLHELEFHGMSFDLHLMVQEPLDFVHELIAQEEHELPVRAVLGQIERMSSQEHFFDTVRKRDWQVGLSLDIFTPLDAIEAASLRQLDMVQLMAIHAGRQGQKFMPHVLDKIAELAYQREEIERDIAIVVDGAVSRETAPDLSAAGTDEVAIGSALWMADDIETEVEHFHSL